MAEKSTVEPRAKDCTLSMLSANWVPLQRKMLQSAEPEEGMFSKSWILGWKWGLGEERVEVPRGPVLSDRMEETAPSPQAASIAGPGVRIGGLVISPCAKAVVAKREEVRNTEAHMIAMVEGITITELKYKMRRYRK